MFCCLDFFQNIKIIWNISEEGRQEYRLLYTSRSLCYDEHHHWLQEQGEEKCFCRLLIFFKINFFEKFFQEYHQC